MRRQTRIARLFATMAGLLGSTVAAMAISGANGAVHIIGSVTSANPRSGSPANVLAEGFSLTLLAQGSDLLENPSGPITKYGYLATGTKTEADENTYLVFDSNPGGPTAGYDYGRHFLYQGHENGVPLAYITRINLDVNDPLHRITLVTPVNPATGNTGFGSIDGSVWNPFTRTLLFTQERSASGGVIEITPGWPPQVRTLDGIVGKGGYEGIHPDDRGNLMIIEDVGGATVRVVPADPTSPKTARQPNSFVYRFAPYDVADLGQGGQLYALQVWIEGTPITFHAADPVGDIFSDAQLKLHMPGTSWPATWVLIHDTAVDGTASFNANAAAKAAGATPFKRPENMQFLPGSGFNTFFFDPTGDTDATSGNEPALAARGAWGSIFRVDFPGGNPSGTISIVVLGDAAHAAFDNLAFADTKTLLAAEDRGDGLHAQLNTLDSVWAFDVRGGDLNPRRFIALGRDSAATADVVAFGDGDNEPTGVHISDGATSVQQMLGKPSSPNPTRWFFTQQHGSNQTYEIAVTRR
jgi:hypothetical protein